MYKRLLTLLLASSAVLALSGAPMAGNEHIYHYYVPGTVTSLAGDFRGNVYCISTTTSKSTLHAYNTENWSTHDLGDSARWVYPDNRGGAWIDYVDETSSYGKRYRGVSYYDGDSLTRFNGSGYGLPVGAVRMVKTDNQGTAWFSYGTVLSSASLFDMSGVSRFQNGEMVHFDGSNGLYSTKVNAIELAGSDLWATYESTTYGVSRYRDGEWTTYTTPTLASNNVDKVIPLSEDQVVIVYDKNSGAGISIFDGDSVIHADSTTHLKSNRVFRTFSDGNGGMWIDYYSSLGLSHFDGTTWTHHDTTTGMPKNYADKIAIDKAGNLWMTVWQGGVAQYNGSQWISFTAQDELLSDTVYAMQADSRGNIWITYGMFSSSSYTGMDSTRGVSMFNGEQWFHFTKENECLKENAVKKIEPFENGDVWLVYNNGEIVQIEHEAWGDIQETGVTAQGKNTQTLGITHRGNRVSISSGIHSLGTLSIVKFNGQKLFTREISLASETTFDLPASLGKGAYLISVSVGDKTITEPILIQ